MIHLLFSFQLTFFKVNFKEEKKISLLEMEKSVSLALEEGNEM